MCKYCLVPIIAFFTQGCNTSTPVEDVKNNYVVLTDSDRFIDVSWVLSDLEARRSILQAQRVIKTENDYIYSHFDSYRVQCVGVSNKPWVHLSFCRLPLDSETIKYWNSNYLYVFDGGSDIWKIEINLKSGEYRELEINTES